MARDGLRREDEMEMDVPLRREEEQAAMAQQQMPGRMPGMAPAAQGMPTGQPAPGAQMVQAAPGALETALADRRMPGEIKPSERWKARGKVGTGMMAGVPEAIGDGSGAKDLQNQARRGVTEADVARAEKILNDYKAGKANFETRIRHCQDLWKLIDDRQKGPEDTPSGYAGRHVNSGWLWNCVIAKHADAVDSFPEPIILPRQQDDKEEAEALSEIIPVIMQRNGFDEVYSDAMWQKYQEGTGAYSVMWDKDLEYGKGDISIQKVNLLNLFWEPGITDIQDSRNIFLVTLEDKDLLEDQYPQLQGKTGGMILNVARYSYDDNVPTDNKAIVVDWYYHKYQNGRKVLHYCKFVNGVILYATENDTTPGPADPLTGRQKPAPADAGLYDDGKYPFVLDPLFPVPGTPTGYGYLTTCEETQHEVDVLKKAIMQNALVCSKPRYFIRIDGSINEAEFADLSKPLVHTDGNLGEDAIRAIQTAPLQGNAINLMQQLIDELKFTTGNTDINNGSTPTGVTAASAIAALKEDSGKSSKDSNKASYRSFARIVDMVIERIRQFYDLPRAFRIVGPMGQHLFRMYDNSNIAPQPIGTEFGVDMGMKMPVFDVEVRAQRETAYTKMAQNELALQFYDKGFFNPQMAEMTIATLDMMDFRGKEEVMAKVQKNQMTQQVLVNVLQIALGLAGQYDQEAAGQLNDMVLELQNQGILGDGQLQQPAAGGGDQKRIQVDEVNGDKQRTGQERRIVERTQNSTRPE